MLSAIGNRIAGGAAHALRQGAGGLGAKQGMRFVKLAGRTLQLADKSTTIP